MRSCVYVFARKRDETVNDQVGMDDGLLHVLAAGNDGHDAQTRAIQQFGGECPTPDNPSPSDFHLTYTRGCARLNACRGLLGRDKPGRRAAVGVKRLLGYNIGTSGTWARFTTTTRPILRRCRRCRIRI